MICLLILTCGLTCVYSAAMVNHDFGTFTMDVPDDLSLNESTGYNGRDALENAVASHGGSISFDELDSDVSSTHPKWADSSKNIEIHYIDCNEDKLSNHQTAMNQMYINSTFKEDSDNLHVYDMSKVNNRESYAVCKENNGKSIVIIHGDNQEELIKMANTIQFK